MKINRQIINGNIDEFIANKGIPKLYFGGYKLELSGAPTGTFMVVGYRKVLEGEREQEIIKDILNRGYQGILCYLKWRRLKDKVYRTFTESLSGFFTKRKWIGFGHPDFDTLIDNMQFKEVNEKQNIQTQPSLRNALAFRYYFKLLPVIESEDAWGYTGRLSELKSDLERIPEDIRRFLPLERFLSNYP